MRRRTQTSRPRHAVPDRQRRGAGGESEPRNRTASTATVIALLGAFVSLGAAFGTLSQISVAKRQNEIAERQSLATLVTNITEQTRVLEHAPGQSNNSAEQARTADAEEAFAIARTPGVEVPAIDYYEMGLAFEGAGENQNAMISFEHADVKGFGALVRSNARRGLAAILYALGGHANDEQARHDVAVAFEVYARQREVTRKAILHNEAFTYLFNVEHAAGLDCRRARTELEYAKHLIEMDPAIADADVQLELKGARTAIAHCHQGGYY